MLVKKVSQIKNYRIFIKISSFVLIFIAILFGISKTTFAYQVNRIFIDYTDFEIISENIYIQPNLDEIKQNELMEKIKNSRLRVEKLFGSIQSKSIIIAGTDNEMLKKFGIPLTKKTGMTFRMPYGTSYIVIASNGLNEDVISHELVHAELLSRLGWSLCKKIPLWFDEGLATQLDYRSIYSDEVWTTKTQNGWDIPKLKDLETNKSFQVSDLDVNRFNYTLSRHEVQNWINNVGQKGLLDLIEKLKKGSDFYISYGSAKTDEFR